MLRLVDIRTRIKRLLDEATSSSVSDTTNSLVDDAINASHRRLGLSRVWGYMLWPREESFTTSSGVRTYALNNAIGKILHIWDPARTEFVPLIPRREWEATQVDRSATDRRDAGVIYGDYWPVAVQPSSATTLRIVSSSASDTTTRQVFLRGLNASGEVIEETLTANGTTQVTSSSSFLHVTEVTKVGTWVGTMTLSTSGGTTLLTLAAAVYAKQYPTIEFVEMPSANITYTYAFQKNPRTLSLDNDIPDTPFPFSEFHVYDALLDMAAYNSEMGEKHIALWSARRDALLKQLTEAQDEAIAGSRPRFVRDLSGWNGQRGVIAHE